MFQYFETIFRLKSFSTKYGHLSTFAARAPMAALAHQRGGEAQVFSDPLAGEQQVLSASGFTFVQQYPQ